MAGLSGVTQAFGIDSSPLTTGMGFARSYKRDTSVLNERESYSDEDNEGEVAKRFKSGLASTSDAFNHQTGGIPCELCQSTFPSQANLKQHIDLFHMKKSMWQCSECKKLFSSKSNLKVHLRVHTRIKPYHCKSCSYSCMHHSSIKEHLAKIHPGIVHTATNPGYAFNSVVVPDPEQFNSSKFNREAFIAEAKESNEKLIAQMTTIYNRKEPGSSTKSKRLHVNNNSITISPISTSSTTSSSSQKNSTGQSGHLDNDEDSSFEHNDSATTNTSSTSSSSSVSSPLLHLGNQGKRQSDNSLSSPSSSSTFDNKAQTPKSLNFSISSLMNNKSPASMTEVQQESPAERNWNSQQLAMGALASSLFQKAPMSLYSHNYHPNPAAANAWSYANQIQFFYNYLAQMCQPNQASK